MKVWIRATWTGDAPIDTPVETWCQALKTAREALRAASSSLACAMVDAPQLGVEPAYHLVCVALSVADAVLTQPLEAKPVVETIPVELWCGDRKVTIYPGENVLRITGTDGTCLQFDEAPYTTQAVQDAVEWLYAKKAAPVRIKPLQWSEVRTRSDRRAYYHIIATTPLGEIAIQWKRWTSSPEYEACLPWECAHIHSSSLDDAKRAVADTLAAKVAELMEPEMCQLNTKETPYKAIRKVLADAMDQAAQNGANSVSMPNEYVEVASWLAEMST